MRWHRQRLARAMRRWRQVVRQLVAARRVLLRLLQNKLLAAWNKWDEVVSDMKRQRAIARTVVVRLLNAKLVSAWDSWSAKVKDARAAAAEAGRTAAAKAQQQQRQRRSGRRVLQRLLRAKMLAEPIELAARRTLPPSATGETVPSERRTAAAISSPLSGSSSKSIERTSAPKVA